MKKTSLIIAAFACVSSLLLLQCVNPNAGNGSDTGNAIAAMLYNPGGSPAANVKVRFYPIHYNPRTGGLAKTLAVVVDSTTTDAQGNYTAKLDTGTYNVLAAGDSGVVYQDSIKVVKDSTIHPPADTLKAPGSIRGKVLLQPGDDARTVFIIFMGTNILNMPDDAIGNFSAANMAEGTYRVRILTTLDAYVPKDTVLSVTAGKVDSLTHDIVLQYTGIPVVGELKISYDTLKQIVTLSWNKPATGRTVVGYNVYRKRSDSTSFASIKSAVADTVYSDSTGVQDQTYEYRVAAVDTNATEGTKSQIVTTTLAPAFVLLKTIGTRGTGAGQFDIPVGIDIRNDTIFIVENGNKRVQLLDATGKSLLIFDTSLANPQAISVLGDNIYVGDNATVKIYSLAGTLLKTVPNSSGTVRGLKAITKDSILVVGSKNVYWIDTIGVVLDSSNYSFDYPKRIALFDSGIVVTDQNVRKLVFLSRALSFKKAITVINTPSTDSRGNAVLSVSTDSQNNIYIGALVDFGKVILLDSVGGYSAEFIVFSDPGDFIYPNDLFISNSKLYVVNSNSTIQVYARK